MLSRRNSNLIHVSQLPISLAKFKLGSGHAYNVYYIEDVASPQIYLSSTSLFHFVAVRRKDRLGQPPPLSLVSCRLTELL